MDMPGSLPISLSAGGGTSGSTSNAGVSTPISTPFNFDGSGWVVNLGGSNQTTAGGNRGANDTTQTPTTAGGAGLLGGVSMSTLCLMLAAYFLLSK